MAPEGSLQCSKQLQLLIPVLSQMQPVHILWTYFFKVLSYTGHPSTPRSSEWFLLFQVSGSKFCTYFTSFPCVLHDPLISHHFTNYKLIAYDVSTMQILSYNGTNTRDDIFSPWNGCIEIIMSFYNLKTELLFSWNTFE